LRKKFLLLFETKMRDIETKRQRLGEIARGVKTGLTLILSISCGAHGGPTTPPLFKSLILTQELIKTIENRIYI